MHPYANEPLARNRGIANGRAARQAFAGRPAAEMTQRRGEPALI